MNALSPSEIAALILSGDTAAARRALLHGQTQQSAAVLALDTARALTDQPQNWSISLEQVRRTLQPAPATQTEETSDARD